MNYAWRSLIHLPTDPDSNLGQTQIWPGLIKVEACTETYMSGMITVLSQIVAQTFISFQ